MNRNFFLLGLLFAILPTSTFAQKQRSLLSLADTTYAHRSLLKVACSKRLQHILGLNGLLELAN